MFHACQKFGMRGEKAMALVLSIDQRDRGKMTTQMFRETWKMSKGIGAIAENNGNKYILHRWTKLFICHKLFKVVFFL